MKSTLIRNGTIVTMNPAREIVRGDILVEGSRIKKIAKSIRNVEKSVRIVDATDKFVIPGLIQTHVHLCQVLFRGEADDLALLQWLEKKIWPMERNHNASSIRASAHIALLEMQKCGTTAILDMGTVRHTHELLGAAEESGIRYWGGKCLMDDRPRSGPLYEETKVSLKETEALIRKWKSRSELMHYALCPRFAVSCTRDILEAVSHLQKQHDLLIHTHASESREEIALIRELTGRGNIEYFNDLQMLNSKTVIVHGVHMTDDEVNMMVKSQTPLVHCPSSNLKLGSGIAPIEKYLKCGMTIGLGSDGAPCNNTMDPFKEMHLAALLQKPLFGPEALPAQRAFELMTLGSAKVLSAEHEIGSLEPGKCADIVLVDRSHPAVATVDDPYSALVYSCSGRDVTDVMIHGRWVVRNSRSTVFDENEVIDRARREKKKLLAR